MGCWTFRVLIFLVFETETPTNLNPTTLKILRQVLELEAKLASGGEGAEALALQDNIERAQAAVAEACVRLREAEAAKEALTQHLQLAQTQLATAEAGAGGEVGSLVIQLKEARAETMERELEMVRNPKTK
jgi:hypothetical protein